MRRALTEIVPAVVLGRKNKAAIARGPTLQLPRWMEALNEAHWNSRHFDVERLRSVVAEASHGNSKALIPVLKGLDLLVFCARWNDEGSNTRTTTFDWAASAQTFHKERR